jgi:crossover junction endodeoxyribonuclease RuvC
MALTSSVPGSTQPVGPVPGRVVGVDPGLIVTGYAVIDPSARGAFVVEAGVIRTRAAKGSMGRRLGLIHQGVTEVLDAYPASALALEQVHSHVRNPRTSILMAHARGVIVLAAAQRGLEVFGYAAARIKKTLTGSGKAPKEQMQHAIKTELGLDLLPEPHDVADACAVALCHYQIARNRRAVEGF